MWFVLVGRNNLENDKLTFHASAPTDLWFHAQNVPGSHVVLKCRGNPGSPPSGILEMTSAIAAYYSKARHSGLVPVIYTQRKYVRKPRGAKAGQVICEREKMIMVRPGLPTDPAAG
jgi:predicted ribosome quality control (RQC) complex YloA/Tae2 family protein